MPEEQLISISKDDLISIEHSHLKFITPAYHFGQKVQVDEDWGIITGMERVFGDYEQWVYQVRIFLSRSEGFREEACICSEWQLKPFNKKSTNEV